MGKIYCGARGSGKTVKLLKQAEALADDGLTPIIVCCHKQFIDTLKWKAESINIDTSKFQFITYKETSGNSLLRDPKGRVLIDEMEIFIKQILGISNNVGFYATLSSEDVKEIKREDWMNKGN